MAIVVPAPGDFSAWPKLHDAVVAVDWDGTVKDTMGIKWRQGFNLALTQVWPALKPYQRQVDEVCCRENLAPGARSAQRFLMLRKMMGMWEGMGLPVPDLSVFGRAIDHVEQTGQSHGTATYAKLQGQFGFDDSPIRWSDLSDQLIAKASPHAPVFADCREVLAGIHGRVDMVVVCAAKSTAVYGDLLGDKLDHLFLALLAQDFAPKKGCLVGLAKRYRRAIFVADGAADGALAAQAGVPWHEIRTGDEAASWAEAKDVLERFASQDC
jgi:hypothetical protein